MIEQITIDEWISQSALLPLADVRSPVEFEHGHVPGAFSLPLFDNEERAQVGIRYKQSGRPDAVLLGFELAGPKWAGLIRQALKRVPGKKMALHCWRGGMRSSTLAWALSLYGFEVYVITGGYKEYRRWAIRQFEKPRDLRLLGGKTGSGKTRILHRLQAMGEQVIDLEELAQHQGSSYGSMNKMVQPTQEQFENDLGWQLAQTNPDRPLWLEDECRKIGRRGIPVPLWEQMRNAPLVDLQVPLANRLNNLLTDYGCLDPDFLVECTERIHKRLGPLQTKQAITAIRENRMADFIKIATVYYDKAYHNDLEKRGPARIIPIEADGLSIESDAIRLIDLFRQMPVS